MNQFKSFLKERQNDSMFNTLTYFVFAVHEGNIRDIPQGKRQTRCFFNKTWCHVDKTWAQVKKLGCVGKEKIVNSFKKIKTTLLKYMEC